MSKKKITIGIGIALIGVFFYLWIPAIAQYIEVLK